MPQAPERVRRSRLLLWSAAGLGVLVVASAVPLYMEWTGLTCAGLSDHQGAGGGHHDAEAAPGSGHPFLEPGTWAVGDDSHLVGGFDDTVTLMTDNGPVVRAGDDGRVLWWVDTDGRTTTAGQAEGVVLVAAGGVLAGFDARSGDRSWCLNGPTGPVVDAGAGDRVLARSDQTWTLLDASDGSVVADLPGDVERHALLSEGRVSTWTEEGFSSHDSDTGDPLHEVAVAGIQDLAHVDDVTVVDLGGELVAFGSDGERAWRSPGFGLGGCDDTHGTVRGFEGLFLAVEDPEGESVPAALTGADGTEVWRDGPEVDLCGVGQGVVGARLFLSTGSVVAPDGPVAHPEPADVDLRLEFAPNGVLSGMGSTRTFHPTPESEENR